jgi:hypothetical protein
MAARKRPALSVQGPMNRGVPKRPATRLCLEALEARCVPTTFTPTTFLDGGPGSGSLRDAVLKTNADTGTADDTILLKAGTYSLTIQNTNGQENNGLQGDLDITSTKHRLIIQGTGTTGATATIIDASKLQDRVFKILKPGTQVQFEDLVIKGGLALDDGAAGAKPGTSDSLGGGILSNGNITLDHVLLENNEARGGAGNPAHNAIGGGICAPAGSVTLVDSTVTQNEATGGAGGGAGSGVAGGAGRGGGVYVNGGSLSISASTISQNRAIGGGGAGGAAVGDTKGASGGASLGGGIYVKSSSLTISASSISQNVANAGAGGPAATFPSGQGAGGAGGLAQGAGLYTSGGMVTLLNSTLSLNTVAGGGGGFGGPGGASGLGQGGGLCATGGTLSLTNTTVATNTVAGGGGGTGAAGGIGQGAGVFAQNETVNLVACRVSGNIGNGGAGGIGFVTRFGTRGPGGGGAAQGGGVYANGGSLSISASTISRNQVLGGTGGGDSITHAGAAGGSAQGGGLYLARGMVGLVNVTVSSNTVVGGTGGAGIGGHAPGGPGGSGQGGGLYIASGTVSLSSNTVAANVVHDSLGGRGTPADAGQAGQGGGVFNAGGSLSALNTLIGDNRASSDPDCSGSIASASNVLLEDGTGSNLPAGNPGPNGNLVGTSSSPIDPRLAPLDNNGGPAQTQALLRGSPAIDAGTSKGAPATDERGVARGTPPDIGAYEYTLESAVVAPPGVPSAEAQDGSPAPAMLLLDGRAATLGVSPAQPTAASSEERSQSLSLGGSSPPMWFDWAASVGTPSRRAVIAHSRAPIQGDDALDALTPAFVDQFFES